MQNAEHQGQLIKIKDTYCRIQEKHEIQDVGECL